ncbi:XRE family transcriptional regulator (plasmid) [Iamia sp. SCSIO 61187]|uniref:hypothetical protein n=1 Tax=Iamia sp. SCSIO 61187 TaxID=2722752 RepID=UPI001C63593A|nr:hypothetical protein [Iamia sp. SCSIO 61187]QYG95845.1 XRE family transcriptional regulator [Iamia sp. SCSIO 61187]
MSESTAAQAAAASPKPVTNAFEASIRSPLPTIVEFLIEVLGGPLVMRIAGRSDPTALAGWVDGTRKPRAAADKRLRIAYRVFLTIQAADSDHVARAWFVGLNPQLGDVSPVEALRADRHLDVVTAAAAFVQTS